MQPYFHAPEAHPSTMGLNVTLTIHMKHVYQGVQGAFPQQAVTSAGVSDEQGFGNPCEYTGKGTAGTGRGKNIWTLAKPLPSVRVMGYPHSSSMGRVSK